MAPRIGTYGGKGPSRTAALGRDGGHRASGWAACPPRGRRASWRPRGRRGRRSGRSRRSRPRGRPRSRGRRRRRGPCGRIRDA
ncbi:hypothetical protein GBA65_19315 [Rubrobacter marinus]|uniref:Uncharacterized protein n=1 Tax=Rubrobacter marinus TaxID=2653852 RepID=A0A6G8Q1G2_9ACTN|nr:hypothetical protein GBA65_19315 [Rubrobacter marinus]